MRPDIDEFDFAWLVAHQAPDVSVRVKVCHCMAESCRKSVWFQVTSQVRRQCSSAVSTIAVVATTTDYRHECCVGLMLSAGNTRAQYRRMLLAHHQIWCNGRNLARHLVSAEDSFRCGCFHNSVPTLAWVRRAGVVLVAMPYKVSRNTCVDFAAVTLGPTA